MGVVEVAREGEAEVVAAAVAGVNHLHGRMIVNPWRQIPTIR